MSRTEYLRHLRSLLRIIEDDRPGVEQAVLELLAAVTYACLGGGLIHFEAAVVAWGAYGRAGANDAGAGYPLTRAIKDMRRAVREDDWEGRMSEAVGFWMDQIAIAVRDAGHPEDCGHIEDRRDAILSGSETWESLARSGVL
jgi:hypothetical protein